MADKNNNKKPEERVKLYRQQLASHKPKNRSSKDTKFLRMLKPIERSLSGEALKEMECNGRFQATVELNRRMNKRNKKGTEV